MRRDCQQSICFCEDSLYMLASSMKYFGRGDVSCREGEAVVFFGMGWLGVRGGFF